MSPNFDILFVPLCFLLNNFFFLRELIAGLDYSRDIIVNVNQYTNIRLCNKMRVGKLEIF